MTTTNLTLEEIYNLAIKTLKFNGCDELNAEAVAETVTNAERDGSVSHGLFRIPGYIASLKSKKVKLINVKLEKNGDFDLKKVMSILYKNNIRFLLVEGGNQLTNKMLDKNLFNEFYLIKTDNKLRQSGKLNIKKIVYKLSKKFRIKKNINQYFDKNIITRFI